MFWIYNRSKKNINRSKPKDICREDYFYETEWKNANEKLGKYMIPNCIEKAFSIQESEYSNVLKQIFKVCDMPCNQNALICSSQEKSIKASRNFRNRLVILDNEKVKKMNRLYLKQDKEQLNFIIAEIRSELEMLTEV
jgi:hypothetical protein